jgi:hypothetical protein
MTRLSIWWWTTSGSSAAGARPDTETTDLENIITDLLEGQYKNPVRVVGFNIVKASILDGASPVAIARALRRLRIVVEWNVVPNRRFSY